MHRGESLVLFPGARRWQLRAGGGVRCALAIVCFALAARAMVAQQMTVLFGTHVAGPGKGFSVSSFDPKTGALGKPEFVTEAEAPAYFILADGDRRLYTCNSTGFVSAYAVADGGRSLTLLSKVPSGGGDPSYISLDKTGRTVFVANYDGGNIAAWALKPTAASERARRLCSSPARASTRSGRRTPTRTPSSRTPPTASC